MRAAVQSRRGGDRPHMLYINNGELQDPRARAQGKNDSATKHSHAIPEEPAGRGSHTSASLCLDGPTENIDASSPARKAHAYEIHEQAGRVVPMPSVSPYLNPQISAES
jgi:hypothetical protein